MVEAVTATVTARWLSAMMLPSSTTKHNLKETGEDQEGSQEEGRNKRKLCFKLERFRKRCKKRLTQVKNVKRKSMAGKKCHDIHMYKVGERRVFL
jgi:hypothetical protein